MLKLRIKMRGEGIFIEIKKSGNEFQKVTNVCLLYKIFHFVKIEIIPLKLPVLNIEYQY